MRQYVRAIASCASGPTNRTPTRASGFTPGYSRRECRGVLRRQRPAASPFPARSGSRLPRHASRRRGGSPVGDSRNPPHTGRTHMQRGTALFAQQSRPSASRQLDSRHRPSGRPNLSGRVPPVTLQGESCRMQAASRAYRRLARPPPAVPDGSRAWRITPPPAAPVASAGVSAPGRRRTGAVFQGYIAGVSGLPQPGSYALAGGRRGTPAPDQTWCLMDIRSQAADAAPAVTHDPAGRD